MTGTIDEGIQATAAAGSCVACLSELGLSPETAVVVSVFISMFTRFAYEWARDWRAKRKPVSEEANG